MVGDESTWLGTRSENPRAWSQRIRRVAEALGGGANLRVERAVSAPQPRLRAADRLERIDDSDQFAASDAPTLGSAKGRTRVPLSLRRVRITDSPRNLSG